MARKKDVVPVKKEDPLSTKKVDSVPGKKKAVWLSPVLAVLLMVIIVIAVPVGGFAYAAQQEQHDAFCSSCHTQPESTFYNRSIAAQPVDLASAHRVKNTNCIDCHSGVGLPGRLSAEVLGAQNAFKFYTKTAIQPAVLTVPIYDVNCLKCHQQVTSQGGGQGGTRIRGEGKPNHYHEFLPRWQAADPNAGGCTSCHNGHLIETGGQFKYQNNAQTQAVCEACHAVLHEGD
jgi:nitrate/TMAO reductase-like tetraheme cytochrome c subunit